jgi:MoaA/NifB/PqqE/SkfB family radical SAM enzyme
MTLDLAPDNICNAACPICNVFCSSFYAKTVGKEHLIQNRGHDRIAELLQEGVVQIDFTGGDPLYSQQLRKYLDRLPSTVRWIRINTNASTYYDFTKLLESNMQVELTLSVDGTGKLFEYTRWPLIWDQVDANINRWVEMRERFPTLRLGINMTVSALNIHSIDEMREYASSKGIGLAFGRLINVDVLDIKYLNPLTKRAINVEYEYPIACDKDNTDELAAWLEENDRARKIDFRDYLGETEWQNLSISASSERT